MRMGVGEDGGWVRMGGWVKMGGWVGMRVG